MSVTHTTYFHPEMPNEKRFRTVEDRDGNGCAVDQHMHPKVAAAQRAAVKGKKASPITAGFSHLSEVELRKKAEEARK